MNNLNELADAVRNAKRGYEAFREPSFKANFTNQVECDVYERIAMKKMIAAENAYFAALDDEAERLASETTAFGIAAE